MKRQKIDEENRLSRVIALRVSEADFKNLKEHVGDLPRQQGNYLRTIFKTAIQSNPLNTNQNEN